jgi:ribosomal protein S2
MLIVTRSDNHGGIIPFRKLPGAILHITDPINHTLDVDESTSIPKVKIVDTNFAIANISQLIDERSMLLPYGLIQKKA